jgi:3-hydroxybutyryl-CoA dehydrogenase
MTVHEFRQIGVVGAGTMGRGIAHLFALHGFSVILVDRDEAILRAALAKVRERTEPEVRDGVAGRIATSVSLEQLRGCDLVIEAVYEDEAAKRQIFAALNVLCTAEAILASNTSAISITALGRAVSGPGRFIGMHFMNPPVVMQLVEVVRGEDTADTTVRAITGLAERLGKVPVVVRDAPGFVANRLLFAQLGEALRLLESGTASREDIDTVARLGLAHPLGPFELADFIGLDVCRQIMIYLNETLGDRRYRPGELLERLVGEGKLGRKSGEGFYRYQIQKGGD